MKRYGWRKIWWQNCFKRRATTSVCTLKNIYEEGELEEDATTEEFPVVQQEGAQQVKRNMKHYNLDAIIPVGYRIKSHVATRFCQWAAQQLREFIVKGFVLTDD